MKKSPRFWLSFLRLKVLQHKFKVLSYWLLFSLFLSGCSIGIGEEGRQLLPSSPHISDKEIRLERKRVS